MGVCVDIGKLSITARGTKTGRHPEDIPTPGSAKVVQLQLHRTTFHRTTKTVLHFDHSSSFPMKNHNYSVQRMIESIILFVLADHFFFICSLTPALSCKSNLHEGD